MKWRENMRWWERLWFDFEWLAEEIGAILGGYF